MSAQPDENVTPIAGKPAASVVYVTPEIAARWLQLNRRNRTIKTRTVNQYVRDMVAGNWQITGEAVKFASDGSLIHGQHRLTAVVRSNVTVPMFVVRGLEPKAQQVMDTGAKRTASDALGISGEKNTALLAATVRVAINAVDGSLQRGKALDDVSHAHIMEFLENHPELRERITEVKPYLHGSYVPSNAIGCYAYWRMNQIHPQQAIEFWRDACEKVGLRRGDPVIAMTEKFSNYARNRQQVPKHVQLSMIFRSWNARRDGRSVSVLREVSSAGTVGIPQPK